MPRPAIGPPPFHVVDTNDSHWREWFNEVFDRIGGIPFGINGTTVAELPPAGEHGSINTTAPTVEARNPNPFTSLIFVVDETGGPTLAFSDGKDWLRVQDLAIVS